MNKQVILISGVVAVLVIGAFLLFNKPKTQPVSETVTTPAQEVAQPVKEESATDSSMTEGVKEFTFVSEGLNFTPNEIIVKVGDKVRITYKNTKGQHNLALDEFNVKTKLLNAGEEETVEFVADKAGTYEFYCPVPGHKAAGMEGMLIVK